MEFVNEFVVPAAVEEAWSLLTDVPRIAPCLPGASVRIAEDGQFEGNVAVKVGPIKVAYRGLASFRELDENNRRMVLDARGKEDSGKGSVAAVVRVALAEQSPQTTRVRVVTDLQVTGKVAQFGRSAMADVGERIIGQFARNLESLLAVGAGTAAEGAHAADSRTESPVASAPAVGAGASGVGSGAEFNALSLAGPLLRRAAPPLAALLVGLLLGRLLGRRGAAASQLAGLYTNPPLGAYAFIPFGASPWAMDNGRRDESVTQS